MKERYDENKISIGRVLIAAFFPIIAIFIALVLSRRRPEVARKMSLIATLFLLFYIVFVSSYIITDGFRPMFIGDTRKSATYADALQIEQAVDWYCEAEICTEGDEFTYNDLLDYVEGIDPDKYELDDNVIASVGTDGTQVYLERAGTGEYEFTAGMIPSLTTRDESVFKDKD